jgi:hypothetical protein
MVTDAAVIVGGDVARVLGGRRAVEAVFAEVTGPYQCPVCGRSGVLRAGCPAVALVVIHDGGRGQRIVCLAHPGCTGSAVVIIDGPAVAYPLQALPTVAWTRSEGADPPVVLACTPMTRAVHVTSTGDTLDRLTSGLLGAGFVLMVHPQAALPRAQGLTARCVDKHLSVRDRDGHLLLHVTVDIEHPWWGAAARAGEVGVVVALGVRADDPTRDHGADLIAAVRSGAVVGARVALA